MTVGGKSGQSCGCCGNKSVTGSFIFQFAGCNRHNNLSATRFQEAGIAGRSLQGTCRVVHHQVEAFLFHRARVSKTHSSAPSLAVRSPWHVRVGRSCLQIGDGETLEIAGCRPVVDGGLHLHIGRLEVEMFGRNRRRPVPKIGDGGMMTVHADGFRQVRTVGVVEDGFCGFATCELQSSSALAADDYFFYLFFQSSFYPLKLVTHPAAEAGMYAHSSLL
ncbi:hypothetical protein QBC44DRAFT_325667, partial [Cladorrhinum sp. PSN332]